VISIGASTPIRFEQTNGRLRHLQIPTTPATAPTLEELLVSFDKFSTQNRRTKRTTKPALHAK
jgi:hypothetical protein